MDLVLLGAAPCPGNASGAAGCCTLGDAAAPYFEEKVRRGPAGRGALGGPPCNPGEAAPEGEEAGSRGSPAMAAGNRGGLASKDTAAVRGLSLPPFSLPVTGPYEDEAQRGVLPASELPMEPTRLMEATLGVLTGVMKGENPPPA